MGPCSVAPTGGSRARRPIALRAATVLAAAALLFAAHVDIGQAQTVVSNWPHSPLNHVLGDPSQESTPSFAANLRGNFVTASNTLLTCPGNAVTRRQRAARRRQGRGAETCQDRNNNDENMRYVDIDGNADTFNSSRAELALPAGARVVRAYLYWGADLARGVNNNTEAEGAPGGETPYDPEDHPSGTNRLWKTALMNAGDGYTMVNAAAEDRDGVWQGIESWYSTPKNRPGFAYQVRADVTAEIDRAAVGARVRRVRRGRRTVRQKTLNVTVADVQAGRGYNRHGGWTLLVAWETETHPYRNITLYDGFAYVQVEGGQQKVVGPLDFTGFQTPDGGDIDAHVATWAYEGDRAITGDYLALGRLGKTCPQLTHMGDALNPAKPPDNNDNFFNGTISTGGNDLLGRTPTFANQLGFDRDRLSVPENVIGNGARGARVCLGTTGDTYFFGGIAFDVLIGAPDLRIDKRASRETAAPGDQVTYTTELTNVVPAGAPTDTATNVVVRDPLPSGLDFAGFADNPGGVCSYDPDTRSVTCNVGDLGPNETFAFSYNATVSAAAQGTSPAQLRNLACFTANSESHPDTDYYGCAPANVEVPPNPYVDLGVVKSVSADVVAPGATLTWTLVATNHGPGTSTGFELRDELPAGVMFSSHTASAPLACTTPAPGVAGSIVCTAPSVAAGTSLTVTFTGVVAAGTANGTVLRNIATVDGDQPEPTPDPHPNRDTVPTTVITDDPPVPPDPPPAPPDPPPDPNIPPAPPVPSGSGAALPATVHGTVLTLRKRADATSVTAGATIVWRLRVRNAGEARADGVRVCDPLPRTLTVVRAPGFRRQAGRLCARVGRLRIGAARVLEITTRATPSTPLQVTNTATARADNTRRVRARATVGSFVACPAVARSATHPVARAAC